MEIFVYHPGHSGTFRPEMLRPMGLPEDVKAINRYVVINLPFLTPPFLHLLLSQQETCHPM